MKAITGKPFILSILLLLSLTNYSFADSKLPTSKQVTEPSAKDDKIEIVDEIKIEDTSTAPTNPKLKTGDACSDEHLEEAKGKLITIVDIPMAKTIPCDKVDCKDLEPAKTKKIIIKKLPPMAKTISCEK